jgi:predicted unusual protein kinase regulating ubiquinone biosynthesis (AarF/ABC1/UbiB family)
VKRDSAERQRQSGVEACFARWELLRGPRRLESRPSGATLGRRLRGAFEELGPVFSAFGLYLASRVDLLGAADALELASLSDRVLPLPSGVVHERIAAELGPASAFFAGLEAEPFDSRLFLQSHRGRLTTGEPVIVRLVRGDMAEGVDADLEMLPVAGEALLAQGWTASAVREAIDGFRQHLIEQADLRSAVQDLDLLAGDAEVFSRLAVPAVFRDLTTARLLTVADLGGVSFGQVAPEGSRDLARSLCALWWRQVLAGRLFPLDLGAEDVRVLPDGRIAFQGSAFARSTAALQADLREALVAVLYRDPDAACTALLREMVREDGARSEEDLRLRLRQIVPFRDGSWSSNGESLAEYLFLYARTARECGYRPRPALLELYRGLFAIAILVRRLAPANDPLSEGLQELRLLLGFSQVREAMSFDSWGGQLDRYALLMASLPQRLDELLTRTAEEPVSQRAGRSLRGARRAESSHLLLAAALMVMAALALLLHHFVQAGALAGQGEKVAATLFLVVGGLLLWALGRTR